MEFPLLETWLSPVAVLFQATFPLLVIRKRLPSHLCSDVIDSIQTAGGRMESTIQFVKVPLACDCWSFGQHKIPEGKIKDFTRAAICPGKMQVLF